MRAPMICPFDTSLFAKNARFVQLQVLHEVGIILLPSERECSIDLFLAALTVPNEDSPAQYQLTAINDHHTIATGSLIMQFADFLSELVDFVYRKEGTQPIIRTLEIRS